jgi:hypothetical protein
MVSRHKLTQLMQIARMISKEMGPPSLHSSPDASSRSTITRPRRLRSLPSLDMREGNHGRPPTPALARASTRSSAVLRLKLNSSRWRLSESVRVRFRKDCSGTPSCLRCEAGLAALLPSCLCCEAGLDPHPPIALSLAVLALATTTITPDV